MYKLFILLSIRILTLLKGLSKSPTSASFIRPSRPTDPALSFLQAVHKKYASSPTDVTADSTVDEPIEISGKVVEEVGFDKIREQQAALQDLKIVLVDGLGVAGIGSTKWDKESVGGEEWCKTVDEITQTCGSIIELDLSRSLLVDWVDVVGVCKALPRLTVLTIKYVLIVIKYELSNGIYSGNRFRDLSTIGLDAEYVHTAFEGVIELSLDETILSWEEVRWSHTILRALY